MGRKGEGVQSVINSDSREVVKMILKSIIKRLIIKLTGIQGYDSFSWYHLG
jgi:hypothetical protein